MDKKFFTILLVAIFLVASIGFVSAADDGDSSQTITVKINWNKDSQSDRPDSVTVNLIKDGKIVDSTKLNAENSWSAKFTVDGDGSYSVKQVDDLSDYSVSTKGSASSGFVITNTFNAEVLTTSESNDTLEAEDDVEPALTDANGTETSTNNDTNNGTDEGDTDTNTTDENDTETTGDDSPMVISPSKEKTDVVKKVEKKVIKKTEKQPKNVTKNKLRNTGLPVIALVIVAFAAAFVPFTRKK